MVWSVEDGEKCRLGHDKSSVSVAVILCSLFNKRHEIKKGCSISASKKWKASLFFSFYLFIIITVTR